MLPIGICEWTLPVKGVIGMEIAKECGIGGIQLDDWGGARSGYPLHIARVQRGYLEAAQRLEMQMISLGGDAFAKDGGLVNPLGTPEGDRSLATLKMNIGICRAMGIPLMILPCFWKGEITSEAQVDNAVAMLRLVEKDADRSGVTIGLECAVPPAWTQRFVDEVPFCRFFLDTQNPHFFKTNTVPDEIRLLGRKKIAQVHLKDGLAKKQGCVPLGEGETGFYDSVSALKDIGYGGWLVLENYYNRPPLNTPDADVLATLRKDVATVHSAFA